MKKLGLAALLALVVMLCAGTSYAVPFYAYESVGAWLDGSNATATITFDLNNDTVYTNALRLFTTDINAEDVITEAELGLRFTDDGILGSDDSAAEYTSILLNGGAYVNNLNPGVSLIGVNWTADVRSYLQDSDHTLVVEVRRTSGDFGIDYARISGDYTNNAPSAVPEPATMVLLGTGLVGLLGLKRKK